MSCIFIVYVVYIYILRHRFREKRSEGELCFMHSELIREFMIFYV